MKSYKNIVIGAVVILVIGGLIWIAKPSSKSDNQGANTSNSGSQLLFSDAVGKQAPDFTLEDANGNKITLSSLRGKNVILFFNEGLMCYPACLNQVIELGKDSRLNNEQVAAFSIVVDSAGSWKDAQKKLPDLAAGKVLFDDGDISRLYDVLKLPSVMHYGAYPGHTYFIIDKNGVIRYTFDDPSMGIRNDQLFAELQKLQ